MKTDGLKLGHALGLFAGSGTSTPTLQAAIATLGNDDPAVGLLGLVSVRRGRADPVALRHLHVPQAEDRGAVGRRAWRCSRSRCATRSHFGKTLGEVMSGAARRRADRRRCARAHQNEPASPDIVVAEDDVAARRRSHQGRARPGEQDPRRGGARPPAQGSPRPRLPARVRVPADRGGPSARRSRPAGRQGVGRRSRFAAATPTSCRGRTSCSSSAIASACSPIAAISRRCASSSATRSRAPPSSATSPSAWAWRSASCSARSSIPLPGIGKIALGLSGVLIVALVLGQHAPHRRPELDHPAVRQPRAAQSRAHAVPRAGRDGLRAEVRRDGRAKPAS